MKQQESNWLETYRLTENAAAVDSAERHVDWLGSEIKVLR
jgi:hypothetical protein